MSLLEDMASEFKGVTYDITIKNSRGEVAGVGDTIIPVLVSPGWLTRGEAYKIEGILVTYDGVEVVLGGVHQLVTGFMDFEVVESEHDNSMNNLISKVDSINDMLKTYIESRK